MAGNIRFHNKFHAYTHYTDPIAGIPDSATDPIASKEFPFLGNMFVAGCLSARGWLDDDGTCRKFLFESEEANCRPAKICGDHMEGALHYSHIDYNTHINYKPLQLEIDFTQDTFKTITCDASDYHIMPVSLSAGCVTSTRFINPSSNGDVELAFHPLLMWLNPRPCILSAGDEAILSMTSFSNNLSNVACVWKTRELDLDPPILQYSPTITLTSKYVKYTIDSCTPILYKFILDDTVDIARIDINGKSILVANVKGDLIWDDVSMDVLIPAFSAMDIPTIPQLYHHFASRTGGIAEADINQRKELISTSRTIRFGSVLSIAYNGCTFDVKYVKKGSIYFNIAVNGADITGQTVLINKHNLGGITLGDSTAVLNGVFVNGDFIHDFNYFSTGYVGSPSLKSTVINNRIWTKRVQPQDKFYDPLLPKYYTIERHEAGNRAFWLIKDPGGVPLYKNFHTNYNGFKNFPLQNAWQAVGPGTAGTVVKVYLENALAESYDGVIYSPGDRDYITDEYVPLNQTGSYYGVCFNSWDNYYIPSNDNIAAYIVPENTALTDDSETIHSFTVPGGPIGVSEPAVVLDPTGYTRNTLNPWADRYYPGQSVRIYTVPGKNELPGIYTNGKLGLKSTLDTSISAGGTFIISQKQIVTTTTGTACVAMTLSCAN